MHITVTRHYDGFWARKNVVGLGIAAALLAASVVGLASCLKSGTHRLTTKTPKPQTEQQLAVPGSGEGSERNTPASLNQVTRNVAASVQMQFMRPAQLEAAARNFPVVYVPFGTIEWHGRHLPIGTDALKAHGILVKTAEKFGGVVYPPVYFESGAGGEDLVRMVTALFRRLKAAGFRVIIGVSGHNVQEQIDMINTALKPVVKDGTVAGIGLWEVTLSAGKECNTDHAAKWETSDMMALYPDLVDVSELGSGPLAPDMKPPDGIGGLDPRVHASSDVGWRSVEIAAEAIGQKARELLKSLPEDQQSFRLDSVSPEYWWMM
ncbi:MAG: creatininase family protein [Candidatus Hydrogenedentes bacterium]|nr:creatininase family protein [Candidatus Hydrogenedentota bacterium]